jgi:hypothetical protein
MLVEESLDHATRKRPAAYSLVDDAAAVGLDFL